MWEPCIETGCHPTLNECLVNLASPSAGPETHADVATLNSLGRVLAGLNAIRYDAKSQRIRIGLGGVFSRAIGQNAGHIDDFGDPAAVRLAFSFDIEGHLLTLCAA